LYSYIKGLCISTYTKIIMNCEFMNKVAKSLNLKSSIVTTDTGYTFCKVTDPQCWDNVKGILCDNLLKEKKNVLRRTNEKN